MSIQLRLSQCWAMLVVTFFILLTLFAQAWRVENGALVPQPDDMTGIFYTGDCYVILYSYFKGNRGSEQFILYFWQVGRPQSPDGFLA
jgi:hypothetical protein